MSGPPHLVPAGHANGTRVLVIPNAPVLARQGGSHEAVDA